MRDKIPSSWLHPGSLKQASAIQSEMARSVLRKDPWKKKIDWIAGVDTSGQPRNQKAPLYACATLIKVKDGQPHAQAYHKGIPNFPYVPGFLGFRESPLLVEALRKLPFLPDLIFVDGHGISHPRGLGIATHLGLLLDVPTIGIAKTILVGRVQGELGPRSGDQAPLIWQDKVIGMALRTKARCRPLYISTGHRISLKRAVQWVFRYQDGYRLPLPIRLAHEGANQARRADLGNPLASAL